MTIYTGGSTSNIKTFIVDTSGNLILKADKDSYRSQYLNSPAVKDSVDDGHFVPGVYRINPYHVHSGVMKYQHGRVTAEHTYWVRGWEYKKIAHSDGPFALNLAAEGLTQFTPDDVSNYQQLALQKAKAKVGNADLELGETLGEYRETIKMLRSPLRDLRKFLLDDRERNWLLLLALQFRDFGAAKVLAGRAGRDLIPAAANTWLELRYGLRPLISTVQSVIEKVRAKQIEIFDPDKIRSAKSKLVFHRYHLPFEVNDGDGAMFWRANCTVDETITVNASIQYRQGAEQSSLDQLGLTPRFLPETAWQLTRCSFVVDWLLSIGPWLASLRVAPSITILGNTVGTKLVENFRIDNLEGRVNFGSVYTNWSDAELPIDDTYTRSSYDREINVDISYLPHFTWGRTLDLFKAIDAASLIWQFMPKRKRKS